MVLALAFIFFFVIAAPVMVSLATSFGREVVRQMNDDQANQPSQTILDAVAAMSPAERVALIPTVSTAQTGTSHKKSDVRSSRHPAKAPISA